MKKRHLIVSLILALVLALTMGLTACGGNNDNGNNGDDGKHDNEQPQTVSVTTVTLNKSTLTLDIGDEETLTATVKPDNATNKTVTWTSDKPAIASVDNGKVTAKADGKSDICTVTVNKATTPPDDTTPVATVTLNKSTLTLDIGGTETLTATVKPDNATNKTVTWTSDKPAIASVDNSGKVTAKADGTAIITATADGKSDTCTVTVNKATTPPDGNTNKYAEIVTAFEAKIRQENGFENAKILFLCEQGGYIACGAKTDNGFYKLRALVKTEGHSLTAETIDKEYYVNAIADSIRVTTINSFIGGAYTTDGTDNDKQMVENMITTLLGDGYTVLYGTISAARDNMDHPTLGANASFDVKAILEKDGSVFEYSETLTVSKSYGDVYQAVLNSTQANKDSIYKCNNNEPTDLGELARLYLAECKK